MEYCLRKVYQTSTLSQKIRQRQEKLNNWYFLKIRLLIYILCVLYNLQST
ncbi:hypothetical protein X975_22141, partial [Stegodyphus mimosarum]